MTPRPKVHIICVGAVYIDTIWTVPSFPKEDTKMRAENFERRRGGNTGNTLEVLSDIVKYSPASIPSDNIDLPEMSLSLVAVLPNWFADDTEYISKSLPGVHVRKNAICCEGLKAAASSTIIQSKESGTRTIISHNNGLPEMTTEDFFKVMPSFMNDNDPEKRLWFHFEGRNPDVTLECIKQLRAADGVGRVMISVECEKPERKLVAEAAQYADVVFYSKLWAQGHGYDNPEIFLISIIRASPPNRPCVILVCTWGEAGAIAVRYHRAAAIVEWARCSAWSPPDNHSRVVDTIGAGDTFIAGMLFGISNYPGYTLQRKLRYAVEIASRKVYQNGFDGLGKTMRTRGILLDPELSDWTKAAPGLGWSGKPRTPPMMYGGLQKFMSEERNIP